MKKTLIVVPLVFLSAFPGFTNAESISQLELARQSVSNYIDAVYSGDITEAVKWVVDTRFDSQEEQIEQYNNALTSDPFSNASIVNVVPDSDNSFIVNLDLTRKETGEINNISLPIIEHEGTWKLYLNGQETMSDAVRTRNLSITQNENNDSLVVPLDATYLGSYEDQMVSTGGSAYSNQFDMTALSLGITGWLQVPGVTSQTTIRFNVVYKGFFSDDEIGEAFHTGFNYWNGEAFYKTISVGAAHPPKGVNLKITNVSAVHWVRIKGHIYGN